MVRIGLVGLGKMGVSHFAIINAHPQAQVVAVCDSIGYVLDVVRKYTGVSTYADFDKMLADAPLDAIVIATPTRHHAAMVEQGLKRGLHVFCEKPFCLDPVDAERLSAIATAADLVGQVGYHYRFVGSFQEMKRLLDAGAIGRVTHALAEAYGPVVLKPRGSTWRSQQSEGGGCLYDYAAHPINLLNWFFGAPMAVAGSTLRGIFSRDTDDEVYSTLFFEGGRTAQVAANWSDESYRKMSTKISVWGTNGRIVADRQECQVYLRAATRAPAGYDQGWNVRYGTELNDPVWFYLRGEEYSSQIDHFLRTIGDRSLANVNSFASAVGTDRTISMIASDAARGQRYSDGGRVMPKAKKFPFIGA